MSVKVNHVGPLAGYPVVGKLRLKFKRDGAPFLGFSNEDENGGPCLSMKGRVHIEKLRSVLDYGIIY